MQRAGLIGLALISGLACRNGNESASQRTAAAAAASNDESSRVIELYFTTSVKGYVEPCGCTSVPLGGLPRLATVLRSGLEARGLVDTGNLLFPTEGLDEVTREQHILKAHVLARAYRSLGALGLNVAQSDLSEGLDFLKELQTEGATPFVSANVRPRGDRGPVVARSFIRTIGGVKLGLTAAAPPQGVAKKSKDVAAIEYGPVLRSEVKSLKESGAEIVVVLVNIGATGAGELATLIPDVDAILFGPGTPIERMPAPPRRVGTVLITEAGSQGQRVGKLTFKLGAKSKTEALALHPGGALATSQRERLKKKIAAYRTQLDAWKASGTTGDAVKAREAQIAELEARLKQGDTSADPAGPFVKVDVIALDESIKDDPAMKELLAGYYQQLQKMNANKGDPKECEAEKGQPSYVGTAKCATCHEEAMAVWQKTKHAEAWKTLTDLGKEYDLTCVGCHVVGYRQPGGFCRLTEAEPYVNVGCENCHGPGSKHAADEDPDSIRSGAGELTCAKICHVPEHSDGFEYTKYVKEITGEGHELSD